MNANSVNENNGNNDDDTNGPAPKPTAKRKRVTHACEACRQRKSRCDGLQPVCALCARQGIECHYRDSANTRGATSDRPYLARLEARLKDMERMLEVLVPQGTQASLVSPPSSSANDVEHGASPWSFDTRSDALARAGTRHGSRGSEVRAYDDSVDGMGSITFANEACPGSFGPTSNSAFLQQILNAQITNIEPKRNPPSDLVEFSKAASRGFSRPSSPHSQQRTKRNRTSGQVNADLQALPPRYEILRLIDVFFDNTGKTFPYLYKPHVLESYSEMQQAAPSGVKRSHLCVLYLVLAFATSHCPSQTPVPVRQEQADVFLQMALALISDIKPAADGIESMQALLLATQYIQGTGRASQTWEMLGKLINASFQVGLCQQPVEGDYDPLETEIRIRIWWMCFTMDRMCSMTYGRPPLVPNMYMTVDMPTEVGLDVLASSPLNDRERTHTPTPSLILYTSKSLAEPSRKLYLILGSVIEKVYENNINSRTKPVTPHVVLAKAMDIEKDLSAWVRELPMTLRLVEASKLDLSLGVVEDSYRFRIILTLRFLNVRMLLHRSVLSYLLDAPTVNLNAMERNVMLIMSAGNLRTCVDAAVETIAIISQATQRQHALPIWWYSVYFCFSAALVVYATILAIHKCQLQIPPHSLQGLIQTLQTAFDGLGRLGSGVRQVVRCRKIVQHLLSAAKALLSQSSLSSTDGTGSSYVVATQTVEPTAFDPGLDLIARSANGGADMMSNISAELPLDMYSFADDINALLTQGMIM